MKMPQYFLIQAGLIGSSTILNDNKYINDNWKSWPKDKDHGKVRVGDLCIVYFTGKATLSRQKIRNIYRVTNIRRDHREFELQLKYEIEPLDLVQIRQKTEKGQLSSIFFNCGHQGFNIKNITEKDYLEIMSHSRAEITPHETQKKIEIVKIILNEDHLRWLEHKSNVNLLHYYSENINDMPETVKRKLIRAGYIFQSRERGKNYINITQKGKSQLRALEIN